MKSLLKKAAVQILWRGRRVLGQPPRNIHEAKFRLLAQPELHSGTAGQAQFPWGMVEYTDSGAIRQQLDAIFFEKIYQFVGTTKSDRPLRIVDCGSNIGLSAIWFLQNYPDCELTCYEADTRLAQLAKANIQRAGFSGDQVVNAAVWTEDGKIGFASSGDDKGSVSHESEQSVDCIDLCRAIPEETDLLKMDIEGAEFPVLKKLFESGAIQRVKRIAVELHDVDAHLGEFAQLLTAFEKAGFFVRFRGGNLPWLESSSASPLDFSVISKGPLYFDLFATRQDLAASAQPARIACFPSRPPQSFPFWVLNPLKAYSKNYRAAVAAQYLLSKKKFTPLPPRTLEESYIYSSVFSIEDAELTRYSLRSFVCSHKKCPAFALGLDGAISKLEASKVLEGIVPQVSFYSKDEVAAWHEAGNRPALAWFCREHIFGFKLALNLMFSLQNKVFYADSDVLWFGDFTTEVKSYSEFPVYASVDLSNQSLDQDLVEFLVEKWGLKIQPPHGCAGICLFNANNLKTIEFVEKICQEIRSKLRVTRLTEQTIVAALAAQNRAFLDPDKICMADKMTNLSPSWQSEPWKARHYAGPWRSQMWIDAFWLQDSFKRE